MKSGTDLTKAPKNPVFDVRYYKNAEGSVMYITHINGKPMTPIPEGYKAVTQEEAQKVGQKAEEAAKAETTKLKTDESGDADMTLNKEVEKFLDKEEATPGARSARMGKINTALTKGIQAVMPGAGLMNIVQRAAGLFADQTGKPAPVETRTGVSAAAIQAQDLAFSMGLSTENAAKAAKAAEAAAKGGVDTNKAASDAVFTIAMEQQSRGIAEELEALNASPSTTPSTASSSRSTAGAGSSFAVSPSSVAATSPVSDSGGSITSTDLGFGTGVDYGSEDLGSFLAKGGLVNKRQYPSKKKRGKGIAAATK
jgi:hypothetical protein